MKFIDQAIIEVKAGKGGNGCVAFRREKFIPKGGPAGGNGGAGGSIIVVARSNIRTLIDFQYRHHFTAPDGQPGSGKEMTGRDGEDLVIEVPCGTVVWDITGKVPVCLADLIHEGQKVIVAKGGRGGRGNASFKSSTRRAPRIATLGQEGETRRLKLELKLIADVGLIGYPNAGKSTLLRRISRARPRVADYPFTTLHPHLGLVQLDQQRQFIVADLPGLIEGAANGRGLGHLFLRHVERTKILVHLVDLAVDDFLLRYKSLRKELKQYSQLLAEKPEIVVGTKIDLLESQKNRELFHQHFPGAPVASGITGSGVKELLEQIWKMLEGQLR